MKRILALLRRTWRYWLGGLAAVFLCLAIAAAIGLRDNIFREFMDPGQPFQTYQPPDAPDYASAEAWAWLPDSAEAESAQAAVFYLHPTTYWGGAEWNAAIDHSAPAERLTRVILPNHAAPFESAGPVYAPRYRQASLYSFLTNRDDARLARRFAYNDAEAAFEAFLDRIDDDAAIIIAGAEQGGLHAVRLLRDVVAQDDSLRERLLAAYIIDFPVPLDLFDGPLAAFEPCRSATDYRCIVSWVSTRPDDLRTIRYVTQRHQIWSGDRLADVRERSVLCVNPLLWTTREDFAPARLNKGAAAAEGMAPGDKPSVTPGATSAQCEDGLLLIDQPTQSHLRRPLSLAGRYKAPPFNLFYADIRENVRERLAIFLPVLAADQAMAEPITETVDVEESPIRRIPD